MDARTTEYMPDIMTGDEQSEMEFSEQARQEECDRVLMRIADVVLEKRDEAVKHRASSGVERRWREDEVAFDGLDGLGPNRMIDYATGDAAPRRSGQSSQRSSVIVNIIRGRCETAEGRFSDIQLPVDDKNWALRVTPVPEMSAEAMRDARPAMQGGKPVVDKQGNQKSMGDIAFDRKAKAERAMSLMEKEIDDQLVECDFNAESRKVIRSSIRMGTGILKGPNVVSATKNSWTPTRDAKSGEVVHVIEVIEDSQPASKCVSVWNVYPSPGTKENIHKTAEYIFERDEILARDARKLIGLPGYFSEKILAALREEPSRVQIVEDRGRVSVEQFKNGQMYETWEYHGDLSRADLESIGIDCSHSEMDTLSACVVFLNDKPIKVELNTLDTGDLPYDFFQWTVVSSDEPWGIGIPRQMIWLQRIITAAWRAMMDNAGDSAGGSVVMLPGVEMADGGALRIGGKNIYIADENVDDARRALTQFQLISNQADLQNIIELALRFVDLETSIPTIFQGEIQEAPETLGATNILVDSSNIGLRERVKLYDDRITRPHIRRYYHHNMQYSDNTEAKGDFNVDPRGVSVLMERDQQARTLLEVFSLKGDPDIARVTDWEKAAKMFYASRRLDILKSDEDLEKIKQQEAENPQAPPTPQVEAATIRTQGELEKEKMRQQSDMAELQFKAEEALRDREHDKAMKEMDLQMKMMEYAEKRNIELDKLKVQLAMGAEGLNLQRDLSSQSRQSAREDRAAKLMSDEKKAGVSGRRDNGMTLNETPAVPEVVTPPTEPPGIAPAGQSFAR